METIHLSDALEIKGKPPRLKYNILEFLTLRGSCSKAGLKNGLGRYYPDISHSVDDLNLTGHIRFAGKRVGRGKMEVYYAISEKGIRALLYVLNPIRFWEILHGYCQNSDEMVTWDKIEEFYQIVIRRHLKYSDHGFTSQLDIFDDLCNNWLPQTIVKSNGITLQKVIETLATHPKITFELLLEKTHEPKKRVKEVLRSHSSTSKPHEEYFSFFLEMLDKGYTDFLIQNIIITTQDANNTKPTYELSLFGVMLCLFIIRYNDMGKLKGGLYRESSFEEYYDKIASNYENKLPLIFKKWNQLNGILGVFTYYNFDIVLDGEIRSNSKYLPSVRKRGNKELIDGIKEIILDNRELMSDFVDAGWKVLGKYILRDAVNRPDLIRVSWLCFKFGELLMLLHPIPSVSPTPSIGMMGFTKGNRGILEDMEKSFADEITAFYYMNLRNDSNIRVSEPRKYYDSIESLKPLDKTPKQCLSLLVEQDKEKPLIKEWLSKWKDDLIRIQKEVLANIEVIV
jgi:hypothetical protein